MKGLHHFLILYFVTVVVFTSAISAFAPAKAYAQNNSFGIKDSTYTYYQKCLRSMRSPSVLPMLDTLFRMSVKDGDVRMQNVSLSTRMDYYYFHKEKDSLIANADRTKAFAKEHGLSKYYYFAWARLITFYINEHYIRTALSETEKMLNEALKENNKDALVQSYQMMGRIYNAWNKSDEVANYFLKSADVLDENVQNDRQYLTFIYNTVAGEYIKIKDFKKAEEAVDNAYKYRVDDIDTLDVYRTYANLYISWNKPLKAKHYIDTLRMIGYPVNNREVYYATEMKYQALNGNYDKALELCNTIINFKGGDKNSPQYILFKAIYLEKLGKYKESSYYYNIDRGYQDSVNTQKFSQELSEQAVLLSLREIQAEKQQLELKMRTRWLISSIVAFCVAVIVLLIILHQNIKIRGLVKKLKKSEQIKTIFLQNLSHEVRTPLNAIMGFSDIMVNTPGIKKEEYEDYSTIISNNSKQLLALFNEALEASEVQTAKEKVSTVINDLCKNSVENIKKNCAEGVEVVFTPCSEDTRVIIDRDSVKKVVDHLLLNASKFTKKGTITLKTQYLSKNKFLITVSDTGPGIPLEKQKTVFESFYKVDDMTKGVGLGLTLCRVIADSIKGSVAIDSSYTDGCRTNFVFPV